MKLYPKKLRGLEDLQREKHALRLLEKNTKVEDLFNIGDIVSNLGNPSDNESSSKSEVEGGTLFNIASNLLSSQPILSMLLNMAAPMLGPKLKKAGTGALKFVAKEFVANYVKWKAVQLGIRGVRHFIKSRKEHDAEKQAATTSSKKVKAFA